MQDTCTLMLHQFSSDMLDQSQSMQMQYTASTNPQKMHSTQSQSTNVTVVVEHKNPKKAFVVQRVMPGVLFVQPGFVMGEVYTNTQ